MDEELRLSLAKRLGLADDATEEQIRLKLAEPVNEETPPEGDDGDDDNGDGDEGEEGTGEGSGEESQSETVSLDRQTYEQLKLGASLAQKHEREQQTGRISAAVEDAVKDGRIPPARREHWTKALKADFDGAKTVLDGLEKGLVPVTVRGSAGGGEEEGVGNQNDQAYPDDWFPEIKTIRAQANKDRRVVNAKEG